MATEPTWHATQWTLRPPPRPGQDLPSLLRVARQAGFDGSVLAVPYPEIYRGTSRLTLEI